MAQKRRGTRLKKLKVPSMKISSEAKASMKRSMDKLDEAGERIKRIQERQAARKKAKTSAAKKAAPKKKVAKQIPKSKMEEWRKSAESAEKEMKFPKKKSTTRGTVKKKAAPKKAAPKIGKSQMEKWRKAGEKAEAEKKTRGRKTANKKIAASKKRAVPKKASPKPKAKPAPLDGVKPKRNTRGMNKAKATRDRFMSGKSTDTAKKKSVKKSVGGKLAGRALGSLGAAYAAGEAGAYLAKKAEKASGADKRKISQGRSKTKGKKQTPVKAVAKKPTPKSTTPKSKAPATKSTPSKAVSTKKTAGGNYPVYKKKSQKAQSFRSAFAAARKAGKKAFTWDGRKYNTKVK